MPLILPYYSLPRKKLTPAPAPPPQPTTSPLRPNQQSLLIAVRALQTLPNSHSHNAMYEEQRIFMAKTEGTEEGFEEAGAGMVLLVLSHTSQS